jgi:hypothetical protein
VLLLTGCVDHLRTISSFILTFTDLLDDGDLSGLSLKPLLSWI